MALVKSVVGQLRAPGRRKREEIEIEIVFGDEESTPQKGFLSTHPPSELECAELAAGLTLDGQPLAPPKFHETDWRVGQIFKASDDPDRTNEPFDVPWFVKSDPRRQQLKTRVEELPIPTSATRSQGSFARVVYGLLDESHCAELISKINEKGFTPALLNIGGGQQQLEPYVRNGHRVICDCPGLSSWIFEVLKPHLPQVDKTFGGELVELNDRLRFLCYTSGQEFAMHFDGNYRRPNDHPRAGDSSRVTVQIYLHDVPDENGGATTFEFKRPGGPRERLPCQPKAGSALIFSQNLEHEGSLLTKGLKYTVRTEAMYTTRGKRR